MTRLGLLLPAVNADTQAALDGKVDKSTLTTKGDMYVATASGLLVRKGVGPNGAGLVGDSSKSDGLAYEYNPQWFPTYKSGYYYWCNSSGLTSTSAALANGNLRVSPWIVTKALSITRLTVEFTAAGDSNSVYRLGIYADDGTGVPTGSPVLDAGSISTGTGNAGTVATGGTPGVYEITVSQALNPGLYWVGGVIQGVTSTQPTIRIASGGSIIIPFPSSTLPGGAAVSIGYSMTGVTGALSTWSTASSAGSVPRVGFKVA